MAERKQKIEPDWTMRSTFELAPMPSSSSCLGCNRHLEKGKVALFKQRKNPHNKSQSMTIALCDEQCLDDYDDAFWQRVARANQGGFRTTLTEVDVEFEFGANPSQNRYKTKYKEI